ncbi:MAG: hypothetical protein Q8K89_11125, partial [Actinomycetota bacterium]|nr:hypothetical protein [Actinomycetota bacterium]
MGDGVVNPASACHRLDHSGLQGSGPFGCMDCHNAYRPSVPQHTDDRTELAHVSSSGGCGPCHLGSLLTEHGKYPAEAALKYQCDLCHASTAPEPVKAAISSGDTGCDACHAGGAGHEAQHLVTAAGDCTGCHDGTSLTSVHQTLGCDPCHESTDPKVSGAIFGGDKSCSACHAQPHPNNQTTHAGVMTAGRVRVFENHDGMGPVEWDVDCSMCHASSQLLTIHGNDCEACHNGANPADSFATWGRSCSQGACHPSLDHSQADPAHEAIAGQNCDTCHEPSWDVYLSTCEWCHDPAGSVAPTTATNLKSAYVGVAQVSFTAPGVHYTFYRLDGGVRVSGRSLVVPGPSTGSQSHTIEYWAVDDAGNEELPHKTGSFTVSADSTAPTTTSSVKPAYVGPVSIQLSVTDDNSAPVAGTYWRLDGAAAVSGKTITLPQPASGTEAHVLEFWSVDASGNEELPHKVTEFTITADLVAPTTT